MQETYEKAITQVFKDEGGYTNESTDPGGPTNWGITLHDAQTFWKSGATSEDIRQMPKAIAEDIYSKHYATPIRYNDLPAGVDYSVLDYAINSGISRSVKTLQEIVNEKIDGVLGPNTLKAVAQKDPKEVINQIWDQRLAFDHSLTHLWPTYGHGWTNRIINGKKLALSLIDVKPIPSAPTTVPTVGWNTIIDDLINLLSTLFKRK